jgi:hypothetical protein
MLSALYVFVGVGGALLVAHVAPLLRPAPGSLGRALATVLARFLDILIEMTIDLTLLLATLAILTAALVIAGVPSKLGALLIGAAGVGLPAMVVLAFVLGAPLSCGLPRAPTYILMALGHRAAVEPIWLYLRERFLSMRLLGDTPAIIEACCQARRKLIAEPGRILSLAAYPWVTRVGS